MAVQSDRPLPLVCAVSNNHKSDLESVCTRFACVFPADDALWIASMNTLGIPLFIVDNPLLLTDAEARQAERVLEQKEEIISSLDAQIAVAMAARENLIQRRNEAHQFLVSNQPSGDVESNAIQTIISEKESELDRLRSRVANVQDEMVTLLEMENSADDTDYGAEVERCQTLLNHLVRDRDEASNILEKHHALLSPVRRLPPEVLCEIFLHCLPDKAFVTPAPLEPPLLLASVCSMWRSISLSTAGLWSSIAINITDAEVRPHKDLIALWVGRSGSHPLSFQILGELKKDENLPVLGRNIAPSLLHVFIPHHTRWRKIHLEYNGWGMETGLTGIPDNTTFPLLEDVYLERATWFDPRDAKRVASIIQAAPRLRSLSWISFTGYSDLNIPWPQLTLLNLSGSILFADDCLGIIQACPMLRSGCFLIILPVDGRIYTFKRSRFVHHNLELLDIRTQGDFREFFARLTLPRLSDLSIEMGYFDIEDSQRMWPQSQFMELLSRSGCSLESLALSNADITPEELIACLQCTSLSVRNLLLSTETLEHTCVTDDVLRSLTYRSAIPDALLLCPNLVNIKFWGSLSSSDGILADMIESRWRTCCSSHSVAWPDLVLLMLKRSSHSADIARLAALDDQSRISLICI